MSRVPFFHRVFVPPALLSALLIAVPTHRAGAQERFSETIGVTEVQVPVRVLVRGRPLGGLTRSDFQIFDRGVQQEIVGFEARDLTATGVLPDVDEPSAPPAWPRSRRLLILFDFGFAGRTDLSRALRGVRSMVHRDLGPDDRTAVATWGPISGLNLLVGFTGDLGKVDLALDAVQAMLDAKSKRQRELLEQLHEARFGAGPGGEDRSAYDALAEELGSTAAVAVVTGPVSYEAEEGGRLVTREKRSWFGPIRSRVEVDVTEPVAVSQDRVVDEDTSTVRSLGLALAEMASLLRNVRGQKDILLLSEGFGGALLADARSLSFLQESFRSLRDGSWALHAVDVRGLPGLGEPRFPSNSLLFMARATGGELVENVNDLSVAASSVLARTSIVYVLSFQPEMVSDPGAFRELEVKLANPPKGARIHHRQGYYAPRAAADQEPYEQRVETAGWLLTNLEVAELEVEVSAETLRDPLGGSQVAVMVDVGGPSLMRDARAARRVDLRLAVLDAGEAVRDLLVGEVRLGRLANEPRIAEGGVRFVGGLGVPPGDYRLRVLVMSLPGGEVYLAGHGLVVGRGPEGESGSLAAPVERDPDRWLVVEAERRTAFFR